ncbi:MAG: D-glycero-beta-D-manno-heptose 1-phosphate adenylyltransferase [Pirellulales bacterium]
MSPKDLLQVFAGLGRPRMLVLGDLMLDRYTWGDAERISQEAPVIVLRADRHESRPGGAANVANMLAGLEAEVACAGIVGNDASGAELVQLLKASGTNCDLVLADSTRPTSVKDRFVGRAANRHPSQILRVDRESHAPLEKRLEDQLIERIAARISDYDALLISDYGKGACTERVLRASIESARQANVPVMIDPSRACPLSHYRGATLIKPNRVETELATGRKIGSTTDALEAGRQLCQQLSADMVLVTLDRDGMILVHRDGAGETFRTHARAVYDITGAGDMVMAMVGLCLAAKADVADAVRLGNVAAGLEVERTGVTVILRDEIMAELAAADGGIARKIISRDQAAHLAAEYRRRGESVVFTNGCFDLLHVGHVKHLAEAAALGNVLIVGVNSDDSVRRLKGEGRPIIGQQDRAAMLAALASVRHVVLFEEDTPLELVKAVRPDVLVKGGTYTHDQIVGADVVTAHGGRVVVTGIIGGMSTTNVLASAARGQTLHSQEKQPPQSKVEPKSEKPNAK